MAAQPNDLLRSLDVTDEALLDCLRDALSWPGVDGLTLEDILQAGRKHDEASRCASIQAGLGEDKCRLNRRLVSFDSGSGWYPVGEFLALDAASAIERATEVFGPGGMAMAEKIPWDAFPRK